MDSDYSQDAVDRLAMELRQHAGLYCDLFKVAQGLDQDPEMIEAYVENERDYKDLEPRLEELLEETEEVLPESRNHRETREEQLYRFYRRQGELETIPEDADWRDLHAEGEIIDNERIEDGNIDYRPLIRARTDVITFIMDATKFDEELNKLTPEIEGDDSEIIENSGKSAGESVRPATVSAHLSDSVYGEEEFDSAAYSFLGISNPEEKGN